MRQPEDATLIQVPYAAAAASVAMAHKRGGQVGLGQTGPIGSAATTTTSTFRVGSTDLHAIDPQIDDAYRVLYEDIEQGTPLKWDKFGSAVDHFVRNRPTIVAADCFFENATPVWHGLLHAGRYEEADRYWDQILSAVTKAETAVGYQLHKGSGYYFWSCNALERGDIDRGLLLMHEALVEDIRTYHTPPGIWPQTSATRVVSLDSESPGTHPAAWWVAGQTSAIDSALAAFGTGLRTQDIRKRLFLKTDPANVFLLVYANASLVRLAATPAEHRDNTFVGQLALGHFFRLAVVLERILAARTDKPAGLFKVQAEELSSTLHGILKEPLPGYPSRSHARDINDQQRTDPDATLRSLLASTATYGSSPVLPIDRAICIGYILRNLGGHHSEAPAIVAEQIDAIRVVMLGLVAQCVDGYY